MVIIDFLNPKVNYIGQRTGFEICKCGVDLSENEHTEEMIHFIRNLCPRYRIQRVLRLKDLLTDQVSSISEYALSYSGNYFSVLKVEPVLTFPSPSVCVFFRMNSIGWSRVILVDQCRILPKPL